MLKFFSRIRRALLEEGSLKKYLAYALGEIFLVVVGILIALQINNWNEARNMRRELNINLEKMYYDLRSDSAMIQYSIRDYEKNYQRGILLWRQLYENASLPEANEFIYETQAVARAGGLDLNDNQFDGMSSNNSLRLIAKEELRDAIVSYYTDEHAAHLFDLLRDRNIQLHDMVVEDIPLEAHIAIIQGDSVAYETWVQQSRVNQYEVLESLRKQEKLPLTLKNSIRSYLLCIRELERKAELNRYIREKLREFLHLSGK